MAEECEATAPNSRPIVPFQLWQLLTPDQRIQLFRPKELPTHPALRVREEEEDEPIDFDKAGELLSCSPQPDLGLPAIAEEHFADRVDDQDIDLELSIRAARVRQALADRGQLTRMRSRIERKVKEESGLYSRLPRATTSVDLPSELESSPPRKRSALPRLASQPSLLLQVPQKSPGFLSSGLPSRFGSIRRKPVPDRNSKGSQLYFPTEEGVFDDDRSVLGDLSTNRPMSGRRRLLDKTKTKVSTLSTKVKKTAEVWRGG